MAVGRELVICWAGRHRRDAWERLCSGYRRRIERWMPVRELPIKVRPGGDDRRRLEAEGRALLAALPEPCWAVALDRGGQARSSEELAQLVGRLTSQWPHPVVFLIGSDLGLAGAVLERARDCLSLGPMTLGHELARLVLYEQLYRALAIRNGIKYHRQRF